MSHPEIMGRVRAYIDENFLYMRPSCEFGDTDSLVGRGIVDSMGVVELLTFVQNEFDITIEDDEVTEDSFGSLWLIARCIHRKRSDQVRAW
jgi:acyl carrier protein